MSDKRVLDLPKGRLKQLLEQKKLSLQHFAARMEVTEKAAAGWLSGGRMYRKRLEMLLEILEIDTEEELLGEVVSVANDRGLFLRYVNEVDDLLMARRVFWDTIRAAWRSYVLTLQSLADCPEDIGGLAEIAPPPLGLPLDPQKQLLSYPMEHARHLKGVSRLLYNFCTAVYSPLVCGKGISECSIIPQERFDDFHEARGKHSKLLNRIGLTLYDYEAFSLAQAMRAWKSLRSMLNLLAYLEIALTQWTQAQGDGKCYLFRLNKDWYEQVAPI